MKAPKVCLYILAFIILPTALYAQPSLVRGNITSAGDGEIVPYAFVTFKNTRHSAASDKNGNYTLRAPAGSYTLVVTALGFEDHELEVQLETGGNRTLDVSLRQATIGIDNVVVRGNSLVRQINESSFNVVAIDAAALHNTSLDLAHALDRVSGVKIRETGGVGSDASVSLNGFSGRHVKIFMDGIPMEGSGSSFGLNNIPVSMADRIEVYKGVVPVELGADALGGAINIVTRKTANTYLDVSYSYGSFNTHRSNISFGHVTPKGFVVQLNAYQNYSDNSYKVKTQLLDLETNAYSTEEYWFRRFHDMYRNEALMAKIGVTGKKWATRFLVGATISQEKNEIQNANLMKIVYGGRVSESWSVTPTMNYEKKNLGIENLDLSLSANYNRVHSNNTDTLSRQYNWAGDYREKSSKGEGSYSLSEYNNDNFYVTGNIRYSFAGKHFISLNDVFNGYSRKTTDSAANYETANDATFMKRTSRKNIIGLSYKFSPNDRMNFSAFGKYYDLTVKGPVNVSTTSTASYELQSKGFDTYGYGVGATYKIFGGLQAKLSFEQAYRLPTERELFGDEVLETGDAALKPENSRNINFNLNYNLELPNGHAIYAEAGLIYRNTQDYIRRQIEQKYGGAYYTNHGKVRTEGLDVELRYFWQDKLSLGGNATWQNIRNRERYSITGQTLVTYNDRMPNVPYMFSSVDAAYNFRNLICRGSILTISYNMNYVHEFYRSWRSEGAVLTVPEQLSHDLAVTYSFRDARYNIAFEANNFTDEMLYDNYSLQKPGRSFTVKVRYFFFKAREVAAEKVRTRHDGGRHRHGHRGSAHRRGGSNHDTTF